MEIFSKALGPYLELQEHQGCGFGMMAENKNLEIRYVLQPKRTVCCNCGFSLPRSSDFSRRMSSTLTVKYYVCPRCTHINGGHQLTNEFIGELYSPPVGEPLYDASKFYEDKTVSEYEKRISEIYLPKIQFMKDALASVGVEQSSMRLLDVGAGVGHFVEAANRSGFLALGIEPSDNSVRASHVGGNKNIIRVPAEETVEFIRKSDCEILSMICLLPHLENLAPILTAIRENPSIQYVFQLLPLFSTSAALSIAAPTLTARVLAGAHTHLHTLNSLKYLEAEWRLHRVAAWWFGTDAVSLLNLISDAFISQAPESSRNSIKSWLASQLHITLDSVQSALDESRGSDQVHLLWKVVR